ncbi:MAG TPA: hypothetical protein VNS88_12515 [Nitrospiraceae bacterium]|nr:hypothetical protein [Nitrospiraceae bacterium]
MWNWIEKLIARAPTCEVCGKDHGTGGVLVGDVVPHDTIYPGHEYIIFTRSGGARPEVWRLGFLSFENDIREGMTLIFTAAQEWQEDETVTVPIMARDISSARETDVDKPKRHHGRNTVRRSD